MTLVRFNKKPRTELAPFFTAFDDLFSRPFEEFLRDTGGAMSRPAVNVLERDDHFAIEVAAPGLRKEDFTVNVDKEVLTISAERETSSGEENKENGRYTRREFAYTSFRRSFTLPESVDTDHIAAAYENGVLTLRLPKREEAKAKPVRTIEIA